MENIPVRTECQGVDGVGVVQSVQMLAVIEIPEHGLGVLAARGTEGAVRGHSDGVQVTGVADVVGLQLAVGQVPYLKLIKISNFTLNSECLIFFRCLNFKFRKTSQTHPIFENIPKNT